MRNKDAVIAEILSALNAEIALIGELLPGSSPRVRTLSVVMDGKAADPFEYDLEGTPAE